MAKAKTKQQLTIENDELQARLQELEETLEAIRSGAVDAIVTSGPAGDRVYTLEGADHAYHTMVESMNEGAVTILMDGTILYANRQFGQMTEASPSEIVGRSIQDFVQASDRPIWSGFIRQEGSGLKAEIRLGNQSAAGIPVQISSTPIDLRGTKALALVVTDLSDRRRYEDLVAAERLSRYILEQSLEGVAVCIHGRILFASRRLHEIYGGNPLMQPFDRLFPLRMSESETFSVEIPQSGTVVKNAEVSYRSPDGISYSLILNAGPLYGDEHRILGCLVSLTDITELSRARDALRESEERYRQLVDTAPDAIIVHRDGWCLFANEAALRLYGADDFEQLKSRNIVELLHPDDRELALSRIQQVQAGQRTFLREARLQRLNGQEVMVEATAGPIYYGGNRAVQVILRDISQRRKAEEALRESEAKYRNLFENMAEEVHFWQIVRDGAGCIKTWRLVDANPPSLKTWGKGPVDEIKGKTTDEIFGPGATEHYMPVVQRIMTEGVPYQYEDYFPQLDKYFRFISVPLGDHFITTGADITGIKRAEKELQKSEARFRLLSETAARLLSTDDPQGLINELCRDVMEYLDCQAFFNFMVDKRAGKLRLNACAGIPEEETRKLEWLDYGVAVCGCVARDGARIVAEDIFHTPDVRTELVRSYGIQAYCCHPLKDQDRLIGTLSFGTKTRAHFTPEEVELMQIVADQVAVAMQRVQAQREIRASKDALRLANEHLEQRVRERTMDLQNLAGELDRSRGELRKLASELVMAEERERKRIAGVLHDVIAQTLAAARMRVDMIQGIPSDQAERLKETKELLAQSIQETRSLMTDIGNPLLFDMGLKAACESLADRMAKKHRVRIHCDIRDAYKRLNPDVKTILYQLIRELLNNVVKHSKAQNAHVTIDTENGTFRVKVTDDGVGFDPHALGVPTVEGGFGLYSIRERLIAVDGTLSIESAPGAGTTVTAIVPATMG